MAIKQIVEMIDDTDGSLAAETVRFSLDRNSYEIDLSEINAQALRKSLAEFIAVARRLPAIKTGSRTKSHRRQSESIREWAKLRGIVLQPRGRIPFAIVAEYEASLRAVPAPAETPTERATVALDIVAEPGPDDTAPAPEPGSQSPTEPPESPAIRTMAPDESERKAIRAWAKLRGIKLNPRGRIPERVILAYDEREQS